MHLMEKTIASDNRVSSGSNIIKKGVVDLLDPLILYIPLSFLISVVSSIA